MGRRKKHFKSYLKLTPYFLLVAASNGFIVKEFVTEIKDAKVIEDVRDEVVNNDTFEIPIVKVEIEQPIETPKIEVPKIEEEPKLEISSELLESGYEFDEIDFETLKSINKDSSAWITIDDTKIDLPIVSSTDNEFYLHHDIEGNSSKSGTLFTDYRNMSLESETLDDITFIYGHHMKGGKMLAQICNYKNQDFYENHKFGIIYTPDGYAYKASVVASLVVDGDDESIIYRNNFETKADFVKYMLDIKEKSLIECIDKIDYSSKYVALVTCSYETNNSRCIVFLKLDKQYIKEEQLSNNVCYTLK